MADSNIDNVAASYSTVNTAIEGLVTQINKDGASVTQTQLDTYVSGTKGANANGGTGDIAIQSLYWQGVTNMPTVMYTDSSGGVRYENVVTRDSLASSLSAYQPVGNYQPAGDYATNTALNAEISRAESAENDKVSGTHGADMGAGDLPIDGLYWQVSSSSPLVNYRDSSGAQHFVAMATAASLSKYQIAGNYEAYGVCLPLTGGTMSGGITQNFNESYASWAGSPQIQQNIGGGLTSIWAQVDGDSNMRTLIGGNNPGASYISWQFNHGNRALFSPNNCAYPEIMGVWGRVVIQQFNASVSSFSPRGTVTFPTAFAAGTTPFVMCSPVTEKGDEVASITNIKQNGDGSLQVSNTSFNYYRTTGSVDSNASATIPVLAIGVM